MKFYGELLIILLLLLTNGRILFIKKEKKDSLVILAPFSLVLSILELISWGLDFTTLALLILSIIVFFSNFHAMFRISERLYVDHYSVLMKFWATITIILSLGILAGTVYFAPVEYDNVRLGVSEKMYRYEGSFRTGFTEASHFKIASLYLREFSPAEKMVKEIEENDDTDLSPVTDSALPDLSPVKDVVLFIPDKRADTYYYKPYLQFLAKEGYTVYSGDFFSKDCKWAHAFGDMKGSRRVVMLLDYFINKHIFMAQKEFYTYNSSLEIKELVNLISEKYEQNTKFFIITDFMAETAAEDFMKNNPEKVSGILDLQSIPEYETPGFGLIKQTDVILANILGFGRDSNGTETTAMVNATKNRIAAVSVTE